MKRSIHVKNVRKDGTNLQVAFSSPALTNESRPAACFAGDGHFEEEIKLKLSIESSRQRLQKNEYVISLQRKHDIDNIAKHRSDMSLMNLCNDLHREATGILKSANWMKF